MSCRNGDAVMVVDVSTSPVFTAGIPRKLFGNPMLIGGRGTEHVHYDAFPDGPGFIMMQREAAPGSELLVVLNWFEELERIVPITN